MARPFSGHNSYLQCHLILMPMRDFFVGKLPPIDSIFATNVQHGLNRAFPNRIPPPRGHVYSFSEFREIGLTNLDSLRGGVVISTMILVAAALVFLQARSGLIEYHGRLVTAVLALLGLVGSTSGTRKIIGRA